ncbi:hypothetical protein AYO44_03905 [Planctomycetaceae bacterium SCGC AG-212-F19]|nr:hypothetical protein AYO44_03905 [Planctomycetaceae bacterium SCGC AG-212-F19]
MRLRDYQTEQFIPQPLPDVFAFFSNAQHLSDLTPPWLHFHILTPTPILMQAGTLIDYRLRLFGMPVRWRSAITVWEPLDRFVDVQLRGPYRQWVHEHLFTEFSGGTLVRDRIVYAVLGGPLEPLVHHWLVAKRLREIFAYRRERLAQRLTPTPN